VSARKKLLRLWRRHRLGVVALLAIVALVLGFIGYLQADYSAVNAAYGTLSLLALNYNGPKQNLPFTLELARFMVPAVAAFATLSALAAVLADQWDLVRARRRRGHFVVCGLGRRGMRLVRSVRGSVRETPVVAIEADVANPNVKAARELGALVVVGDSTEEEILSAAATKRAATLVSLLPEDADNAAVASVARELCRGRRGILDAYCHVTDLDLVADLTSAAMGTASDGLMLEWFSVPERAARLLLSEHAGLLTRSRDGDPPHLVVVGQDDLARALVVNAARQWHAVAGEAAEPIRITAAWEGARPWLDRLTDRHPSVARAAHLKSYEHDLRAVTRVDEARRALDGATTAFVCAPTDIESLELGFAASRALTGAERVVVRLLIENAGFVELLGAEGGSDALHLFSVVDRACSVEMVTDGLNESLARAIHGVYLRQNTGSDASVPWEDLADTFRRSSRAQAHDIRAKLRELGCGIRPLTDWDTRLVDLNAAEVDKLAELEHARWSREQKEQGIVWGPCTDLDAEPPTNQWIDVAWNDLPAEVADYDRAFVRELPALLASAGYELYRTR
jgi:TrkA-N domain